MLQKIKNLTWKLGWLLQNYKKIQPGVEFLPGVFQGPVTYKADGVITSNNCDFIQDARFKRAYASAAATNPWEGFNIPWRVYVVCTLADMVKELEGDFVECGVNTGAYSRAVIDYIDFTSTGKTFFLLDTFEGLVASQISEAEYAAGVGSYLGSYRKVLDEVTNTFKSFPVRIVPGMVPDTLPQVTSQKLCYLSVDMNVMEPEIAAVNFFWDKIVSGGVIILDDYGFPAHIEQKKAFDEFAAKKGVQILYIPTGQGIIFKP